MSKLVTDQIMLTFHVTSAVVLTADWRLMEKVTSEIVQESVELCHGDLFCKIHDPVDSFKTSPSAVCLHIRYRCINALSSKSNSSVLLFQFPSSHQPDSAG